MAKITFNVPDAWVGENEYVYGIVEEGITRADTGGDSYSGHGGHHASWGVVMNLPAWLYLEGSIRDGFEVVREPVMTWVDPTCGHGGGNWENVMSPKFWRRIK